MHGNCPPIFSEFEKLVTTGQAMYCNVTLRRVRKPLLQWKNNEYYTICVCICSLKYPACNAHAPYHLWPVPLYIIFPHYIINGTIFEKKKLLIIKCLFQLSLQYLFAIFFSLRRTERDVIGNVYRSSCNVNVILVRF